MPTTSSTAPDAALGPDVARRRRNTTLWVCALGLLGLTFDGYDLVIFSTFLGDFIKNPSLIGPVTKETGGFLGSLALLGVLVGALGAGSVADLIGRRKLMLVSFAWFSIGMLITSFMHTYSSFGAWRFITGLGVGALVATTGALVTEYAPAKYRNTATAIVYCGVPLGSLLAALLAVMLKSKLGWTGMFQIGALPIVTLLPLAYFKMPESVAWLASRGRLDEAAAISARTGVPVPVAKEALKVEHSEAGRAARKAEGPAGFAGLFSLHYLLPTITLGLTCVTCLLLVYALNTWLPVLMQTAGMPASQSLFMLVSLNAGAILGAIFGSRFSDRFGPKPTVITFFAIGVVSIFALTLSKDVGMLMAIVAVVGLGTSGTQTLIFAMVATFYRTNVRGAGVAWAAGFGRIGGVLGPILGGMLAAKYSNQLSMVFYILAAIGLLGLVLCAVTRRGVDEESEMKATVAVEAGADHLGADTVVAIDDPTLGLDGLPQSPKSPVANEPEPV